MAKRERASRQEEALSKRPTKTYDVEMIRDFLDHLTWEVGIAQYEQTVKPGVINEELVEQLAKYTPKYGRVLLPMDVLDEEGVTKSEAKCVAEVLRKEVWYPTYGKRLEHLEALSGLFNIAAVQLGYLPVNPLAQLRQDRVPDQPIRYVSPTEYEAILAECREMNDTLWWECFLAVCYTAGTRLNEAAHLTWADIDFEANTIRISAKPDLDGVSAWRPKDYDSRTIPIPAQTLDLLTHLHAEAPEGSKFVFLSPARLAWIKARRESGAWREGQLVLNNVNKNFQRRARRAGVADVTLHDLRRSCITHWARKLAPAVVKELAGHADFNTTLRYYVSIGAADLAEAREVTERALQLDPK